MLFMFSVEIEKQIFCDIKVVNNTEHHVGFKVLFLLQMHMNLLCVFSIHSGIFYDYLI